MCDVATLLVRLSLPTHYHHPRFLAIFEYKKFSTFAFIAIKFFISNFVLHNESLESAYKCCFYSVITWVGISARDAELLVLQDSGQTLRAMEKSLALFEVQQIGASGRMLSDSSMECKVGLHSIVLEDTRPGRKTAITR